MNAKLKISRNLLDNHEEDLGEVSFMDSDYFNLYNNVAVSSDLVNLDNKLWLGWQVKIKDETITVSKQLPILTDDIELKIGESATLDFQGLGKYKLNLISIN